MKRLLFTLFDSASQLYAPPMVFHTFGEAERVIRSEVNCGKEGYSLAQHPDDYMLYHIGEYDDNTGRITTLEDHVLVARCKDLKNPVN